MNHVEYYQQMIDKNLPNYNTSVKDISGYEDGPISISEGIQVEVSREGVTENIFDSLQIIKGSITIPDYYTGAPEPIKDIKYDREIEEAAEQLMASILGTVNDYEIELEQLEEKKEKEKAKN